MKSSRPLIDLAEVPPIGTLLLAPQGTMRLVEVQPYTRIDGTPSQVLVWQDNANRRFTSGLRGKSLSRQKERGELK